MADAPKILVFAGSTRKGSLNKKVAKAAVPFLEEAGGKVTYLELNELPLPLYDGDLESDSGIPENAATFKKLLMEHDAFFIASPEYNGFFPAVLKNIIDWASRPMDGLSAVECFNDKLAAVVAASPGGLGGMRSLVSIRQLLTNLKTIVIPQQLAVGFAGKLFDDQDQLIDDKTAAQLREIAVLLVTRIQQLKS